MRRFVRLREVLKKLFLPGLEKALAQDGIRMLRTPVGDKYVMEEMLKPGFLASVADKGRSPLDSAVAVAVLWIGSSSPGT